MLIDRLLYPVRTLGPGERLVIWTVGCPRRCPDCANPELWEFDRSRNVDLDELAVLLRQYLAGKRLDGVTVTGGEPLAQAEELLRLLELLRTFTDDVLVYTGYTLEQLQELLPEATVSRLRSLVSVLIDGPYIRKLNDNRVSLRGSTNQRLIFFDPSCQERYDACCAEGRKVENIFYDNRMISVGIHNRGK